MPAVELRAGFAKLDVTPPLAVPYLSFHPRQTPFGGIHDRLFVRALAVDNGSAGVILLAVDSLGISRSVFGAGRDFVAEVRAAVAAGCGIPADHVLLAASHAHSTPQTTDIADLLGAFPHLAEWLEGLRDQLVAAAVAAWSGRDVVTLHGAVGLAPGIAWNRRILTTDGRLCILANRPADDEVVKEPRDDRVPVLLFRGPTRRGAVIGFTCHPTTVQVQPLVSADYPGVACGLVERELDLEACLFLQGACGDVGPVRRTSNFADVALYGRALGGEATRALALLDAVDTPAMTPAIVSRSRTLELPRRELPDRAALTARAAELARGIETACEADRAAAIAAYRAVAEPLRLCELGDGPVPVEIQAIRIGEALFVAVEGELFCEYGLALKESSPAPVTFVVGYSNGYQGYFPTPAAWDEGGYEPSLGPWTRVDRTGGERIVAAAAALARDVWEEGQSS